METTSSRIVLTKDLASSLGMTPEGLTKKARREGWKYSIQNGIGRAGKTVSYKLDDLPEEIQKNFLFVEKQRAKDINLNQMPEWQRRKVIDKMYLLDCLEKEFEKLENRRLSKEKIMKLFIESFKKGKISEEILSRNGTFALRTLQEWLRQYKEYKKTNDIDVLAPSYGKKKGIIKLTSSDQDFFIKNYNNPNRLPITTVWTAYKNKCDQEKREPVCYSTATNFIRRIPYIAKVLYREGEETFKKECLPHIHRRTDDLVRNEWITSDGHDLNLYVIDSKGREYRPVIAVWKDIASRIILGYNFNKTENTELIIETLADSIKNYGKPQNIKIDNGKAYKNKQTHINNEKIIGTYKIFGIEAPSFSIPYNPEGKANVESFWNVVDNYFSKIFPTYCGKNKDERPKHLKETIEKLKKEGKMPTIQDLYIEFEKFVKWYNETRVHSAIAMTPKQKWDSYTNEIEKISEDKLIFGTVHRRHATVQRDGILFNGHWYRDAEGKLTREYFKKTRRNEKKKKVVVGIDMHDFSKLFIYTDDDKNELICVAEKRNLSSWKKTNEANNLNELKAIKKEIKTQKEAIKTFAGSKENLKDLKNFLYNTKEDTNIQNKIEKEVKLPKGVL